MPLIIFSGERAARRQVQVVVMLRDDSKHAMCPQDLEAAAPHEEWLGSRGIPHPKLDE